MLEGNVLLASEGATSVLEIVTEKIWCKEKRTFNCYTIIKQCESFSDMSFGIKGNESWRKMTDACILALV